MKECKRIPKVRLDSEILVDTISNHSGTSIWGQFAPLGGEQTAAQLPGDWVSMGHNVQWLCL
ncbi:putative NADH:ubiquinone reductase (non-electrogenic) [Helianthus annuus]|nr:putative NADH:ubiquinone reductase (non-electrogenic) [Helianthus annuus]